MPKENIGIQRIDAGFLADNTRKPELLFMK